MVQATQMRASNGGGLLNSSCVTPDQMHVDWVMGSPLVQFTSHTALHTKLVRKTTDHYVIFADAVLPSEPVVDTGTTHVVVLALDGLTSRALAAAAARGDAPHLESMLQNGASTLNARTAVESTGRLANLAGMLTGRPVDPANGGTGIGWHGSSSRGPLASSAGHYISSMFDVVHNYGRSTAFFASRQDVDLLASSWNAANGGRRPLRPRQRPQQDRPLPQRPTATMPPWTPWSRSCGSTPAKLTVAQLVRLEAVGQKYGFRSDEYAAALADTDRLIGRVQAAIADSTRLDGHTLLVVTANRGGTHSHANADDGALACTGCRCW